MLFLWLLISRWQCKHAQQLFSHKNFLAASCTFYIFVRHNNLSCGFSFFFEVLCPFEWDNGFCLGFHLTSDAEVSTNYSIHCSRKVHNDYAVCEEKIIRFNANLYNRGLPKCRPHRFSKAIFYCSAVKLIICNALKNQTISTLLKCNWDKLIII